MRNQFTELSNRVIGCAIEVHKELGPGLLESTYQQCLAHELKRAGISFQMELPLPVTYKDSKIDCGYRVDLLIEDEIILELKAVETLLPIHKAQLITYLRLSAIHQGFLINFNVQVLKNGLKSLVFDSKNRS
ncbi:MAG: GxxExxY protein [Verrucomicrobiota bacterium]